MIIHALKSASKNALLAQLDRVFGYEPKGQGFESLAAHHRNGVPVGMPFLFFGKKSFLCAARDSNPKGTSP